MIQKTDRQKAGLAGILLIVTSIALLSQTFGMSKTLDIQDLKQYNYMAVDDHFEGGFSNAKVEVDNDKLVLDCEIVPSNVNWPYCSLSIKIAEGEKGLDLSHYSYFKLWVKFEKPQPHGIRFQVRNYNPEYSNPKDDLSLKYNVVEFYGKTSSYPVTLPLQSFQVPTWWLSLRELPHSVGIPEFTDVRSIDIVTGYTMPPGHYRIEIEKIEIVGKVVDGQKLYLILLLIWGTIGLLYLVLKLTGHKRKTGGEGKRSRELDALSDLLQEKADALQDKLFIDTTTGALEKNSLSRLFERNNEAELRFRLALMFIDIDNFDRVVLHYGQPLADKILAKFATLINDTTRMSDTVARWGDHEFLLVCTRTELANATILAEKIRVKVEQETWPENIKITASIGVAVLNSDSPLDLIRDAEKALGSARAQGKNKVVSSTPHMAEKAKAAH